MKINKVTLNNFKSYYNREVFKFKSGLNIISGSIGSGKTSFFEGFQWILLDEISSKQVEPEFLINKKYENESLKNEVKNIFTEVSLELEDENETIIISKKANFSLQKENYRLNSIDNSIVYKNHRTGNTKITDDEYEFKAQLDAIFPRKLRRYLLFKGEHIQELIDFNNPKTLEQAVERISHLPLLNKMLGIVEEIRDLTYNKFQNVLRANTRDNNKFIKTSRDLGDERVKEGKAKEKFDETNNKIEELERKEDEYVEKLNFIAGFPEKQQQQININSDIKIVNDEIEKLDNKSKNQFSLKWMLIGSENLLEQSSKELEKFREWRTDQLNLSKEQLELGVPGDVLVNKMLHNEKCLICGTDAPKNSKKYKAIESHLDKNKNIKVLSEETEELYEKVLDLAGKINPIKNSLPLILPQIRTIKLETEKLDKKKAELMEKAKSVKSEIDELIKEKGYSITTLNHNSIKAAYDSVKGELKEKRKWLNIYQNQIDNSRTMISKHKNVLLGLTVRELNIEELPEKKSLNNIELLLDIIKEKVKKEKKSLIKNIESTTNNIQSEIIAQNPLITLYVDINDDDYTLSFKDKAGNNNPGHGAQSTLAKLSIISAVLKLSNEYKNESYPFIVDAPTSNFDDTIIKPFIQSVSQNFTQSIVVLKDIKNKIEEYRNEEFVQTIYNIEKNSTEIPAIMTNSFTVKSQIK